MSEENFNEVVGRARVGATPMRVADERAIIWAQNEISQLRADNRELHERVNSLDAVIREARERNPVYFHQVGQLGGKLFEEVTKDEMERYGTIFQRVLYPSPEIPAMPAQQSPAVVEVVADFVEKQEGGPYMPQVISAAILGQLKYGDTFKNIPSTFDRTKAPSITEKDAREMYKIIRDIVQNYECGDEVDSKLRPLLNKLNAEIK